MTERSEGDSREHGSTEMTRIETTNEPVQSDTNEEEILDTNTIPNEAATPMAQHIPVTRIKSTSEVFAPKFEAVNASITTVNSFFTSLKLALRGVLTINDDLTVVLSLPSNVDADKIDIATIRSKIMSLLQSVDNMEPSQSVDSEVNLLNLLHEVFYSSVHNRDVHEYDALLAVGLAILPFTTLSDLSRHSFVPVLLQYINSQQPHNELLGWSVDAFFTHMLSFASTYIHPLTHCLIVATAVASSTTSATSLLHRCSRYASAVSVLCVRLLKSYQQSNAGELHISALAVRVIGNVASSPQASVLTNGGLSIDDVEYVFVSWVSPLLCSYPDSHSLISDLTIQGRKSDTEARHSFVPIPLCPSANGDITSQPIQSRSFCMRVNVTFLSLLAISTYTANTLLGDFTKQKSDVIYEQLDGLLADEDHHTSERTAASVIVTVLTTILSKIINFLDTTPKSLFSPPTSPTNKITGADVASCTTVIAATLDSISLISTFAPISTTRTSIVIKQLLLSNNYVSEPYPLPIVLPVSSAFVFGDVGDIQPQHHTSLPRVYHSIYQQLTMSSSEAASSTSRSLYSRVNTRYLSVMLVTVLARLSGINTSCTAAPQLSFNTTQIDSMTTVVSTVTYAGDAFVTIDDKCGWATECIEQVNQTTDDYKTYTHEVPDSVDEPAEPLQGSALEMKNITSSAAHRCSDKQGRVLRDRLFHRFYIASTAIAIINNNELTASLVTSLSHYITEYCKMYTFAQSQDNAVPMKPSHIAAHDSFFMEMMPVLVALALSGQRHESTSTTVTPVYTRRQSVHVSIPPSSKLTSTYPHFDTISCLLLALTDMGYNRIIQYALRCIHVAHMGDLDSDSDDEDDDTKRPQKTVIKLDNGVEITATVTATSNKIVNQVTSETDAAVSPSSFMVSSVHTLTTECIHALSTLAAHIGAPARNNPVDMNEMIHDSPRSCVQVFSVAHGYGVHEKGLNAHSLFSFPLIPTTTIASTAMLVAFSRRIMGLILDNSSRLLRISHVLHQHRALSTQQQQQQQEQQEARQKQQQTLFSTIQTLDVSSSSSQAEDNTILNITFDMLCDEQWLVPLFNLLLSPLALTFSRLTLPATQVCLTALMSSAPESMLTSAVNALPTSPITVTLLPSVQDNIALFRRFWTAVVATQLLAYDMFHFEDVLVPSSLQASVSASFVLNRSQTPANQQSSQSHIAEVLEIVENKTPYYRWWAASYSAIKVIAIHSPALTYATHLSSGLTVPAFEDMCASLFSLGIRDKQSKEAASIVPRKLMLLDQLKSKLVKTKRSIIFSKDSCVKLLTALVCVNPLRPGTQLSKPFGYVTPHHIAEEDSFVYSRDKIGVSGYPKRLGSTKSERKYYKDLCQDVDDLTHSEAFYGLTVMFTEAAKLREIASLYSSIVHTTSHSDAVVDCHGNSVVVQNVATIEGVQMLSSPISSIVDYGTDLVVRSPQPRSGHCEVPLIHAEKKSSDSYVDVLEHSLITFLELLPSKLRAALVVPEETLSVRKLKITKPPKPSMLTKKKTAPLPLTDKVFVRGVFKAIHNMRYTQHIIVTATDDDSNPKNTLVVSRSGKSLKERRKLSAQSSRVYDAIANHLMLTALAQLASLPSTQLLSSVLEFTYCKLIVGMTSRFERNRFKAWQCFEGLLLFTPTVQLSSACLLTTLTLLHSIAQSIDQGKVLSEPMFMRLPAQSPYFLGMGVVSGVLNMHIPELQMVKLRIYSLLRLCALRAIRFTQTHGSTHDIIKLSQLLSSTPFKHHNDDSSSSSSSSSSNGSGKGTASSMLTSTISATGSFTWSLSSQPQAAVLALASSTKGSLRSIVSSLAGHDLLLPRCNMSGEKAHKLALSPSSPPNSLSSSSASYYYYNNLAPAVCLVGDVDFTSWALTFPFTDNTCIMPFTAASNADIALSTPQITQHIDLSPSSMSKTVQVQDKKTKKNNSFTAPQDMPSVTSQLFAPHPSWLSSLMQDSAPQVHAARVKALHLVPYGVPITTGSLYGNDGASTNNTAGFSVDTSVFTSSSALLNTNSVLESSLLAIANLINEANSRESSSKSTNASAQVMVVGLNRTGTVNPNTIVADSNSNNASASSSSLVSSDGSTTDMNDFGFSTFLDFSSELKSLVQTYQQAHTTLGTSSVALCLAEAHANEGQGDMFSFLSSPLAEYAQIPSHEHANESSSGLYNVSLFQASTDDLAVLISSSVETLRDVSTQLHLLLHKIAALIIWEMETFGLEAQSVSEALRNLEAECLNSNNANRRVKHTDMCLTELNHITSLHQTATSPTLRIAAGLACVSHALNAVFTTTTAKSCISVWAWLLSGYSSQPAFRVILGRSIKLTWLHSMTHNYGLFSGHMPTVGEDETTDISTQVLNRSDFIADSVISSSIKLVIKTLVIKYDINLPSSALSLCSSLREGFVHKRILSFLAQNQLSHLSSAGVDLLWITKNDKDSLTLNHSDIIGSIITLSLTNTSCIRIDEDCIDTRLLLHQLAMRFCYDYAAKLHRLTLSHRLGLNTHVDMLKLAEMAKLLHSLRVSVYTSLLASFSLTPSIAYRSKNDTYVSTLHTLTASQLALPVACLIPIATGTSIGLSVSSASSSCVLSILDTVAAPNATFPSYQDADSTASQVAIITALCDSLQLIEPSLDKVHMEIVRVLSPAIEKTDSQDPLHTLFAISNNLMYANSRCEQDSYDPELDVAALLLPHVAHHYMKQVPSTVINKTPMINLPIAHTSSFAAIRELIIFFFAHHLDLLSVWYDPLGAILTKPSATSAFKPSSQPLFSSNVKSVAAGLTNNRQRSHEALAAGGYNNMDSSTGLFSCCGSVHSNILNSVLTQPLPKQPYSLRLQLGTELPASAGPKLTLPVGVSNKTNVPHNGTSFSLANVPEPTNASCCGCGDDVSFPAVKAMSADAWCARLVFLWEISPAFALGVARRFASHADVVKVMISLVQNQPTAILNHPEALAFLIPEAIYTPNVACGLYNVPEVASYFDGSSSVMPSVLPPHVHRFMSALRVLPDMAASTLSQALLFLSPPYARHRPLVKHAVESLKQLPGNTVWPSLPQLLQLLRFDMYGELAQLLISVSRKSPIMAHTISGACQAELAACGVGNVIEGDFTVDGEKVGDDWTWRHCYRYEDETVDTTSIFSDETQTNPLSTVTKEGKYRVVTLPDNKVTVPEALVQHAMNHVKTASVQFGGSAFHIPEVDDLATYDYFDQVCADDGYFNSLKFVSVSALSQLDADGTRLYLDQNAFFEEIIGLSGKLVKLPRPERRPALVAALAVMKIRPGIYLPTNPDLKIVALHPDSGRTLQSAAKVPILVSFDVVKHSEEENTVISHEVTDITEVAIELEEDSHSHANVSTSRSSQCNSNAFTHEKPVKTALIFKSHDDIRQDSLALQIVSICQNAFFSSGTDLIVSPYRVLPNSINGIPGGVIECIPNAMSRDEIGKKFPSSLKTYFINTFGSPNSAKFQHAQRNFIRSLAGYAVVSYLLQVKDRHNGNIMINDQGNLIHIDFGFIFDISPGGDMRFERPAFKLTTEMIELMGDRDVHSSPLFIWFIQCVIRGFLAVRSRMMNIVTNTLPMLTSTLKCFKGEYQGIYSPSLIRLYDRFFPHDNDTIAAKKMYKLIIDANSNWRTNTYDWIQLKQQNIFYWRGSNKDEDQEM